MEVDDNFAFWMAQTHTKSSWINQRHKLMATSLFQQKNADASDFINFVQLASLSMTYLTGANFN